VVRYVQFSRERDHKHRPYLKMLHEIFYVLKITRMLSMRFFEVISDKINAVRNHINGNCTQKPKTKSD
jgi:hypothetical protein